MDKPNYLRMFLTTAFGAWLLLLAYVGWIVFQSWPTTAFGPLRAENGLLLQVNVLVAAGQIALIRVGLTALLRGDLFQHQQRDR